MIIEFYSLAWVPRKWTTVPNRNSSWNQCAPFPDFYACSIHLRVKKQCQSISCRWMYGTIRYLWVSFFLHLVANACHSLSHFSLIRSSRLNTLSQPFGPCSSLCNPFSRFSHKVHLKEGQIMLIHFWRDGFSDQYWLKNGALQEL